MPAVAAQTETLSALLHRVFGHRDFRPHQQQVCEAAADGRDVLLVMPTGAGKSLCYQLPALARGGTALVISPLIALMDDQASKLTALGLCVSLFLPAAVLHAQRSPYITPTNRDVVQGALIAPGSPPFHLHAVITKGREQLPYGEFDIVWAAPNDFRRVTHTSDFRQNLVVSGTTISETDDPSYFPLVLRTLTTAALDPKAIIDAVRPGDRVDTKANGAVNESGLKCFDPQKKLCVQSAGGLRETVAASGHAVEFGDYKTFHDKRIARSISNAPRLGEEPVLLTITTLEDIDPKKEGDPDPAFTVKETNSTTQPLRFAVLSDDALRDDILGSHEIIWPQSLDGAEKGPASFYVSFDTTGTVREVQELYTVNERTNEPAVNQIKRWKFKPVTQGGFPAQGEGVLSFTVDTRAFGPKDPLPDEQARKLATNIVEATLPAGKLPSGTRYTVYAAIDADGHLIEAMPAADSAGGYFMPCYDAIRQWRFSPLMIDGQPRPYRALINFKFP